MKLISTFYIIFICFLIKILSNLLVFTNYLQKYHYSFSFKINVCFRDRDIMSPHSFFSKRAFKEVKDIFTTANSIKPRRSNSCSPLRGSQPTYRSITSSPRTSRTSKTSRYGITSRSTSGNIFTMKNFLVKVESQNLIIYLFIN